MAQQTKAPPRSRNVSQESQQQNVVIAAERLPVPIGLTERFGYDRAAWRALCEAVFPMAKTSGAIVLALAYCRARKLDPFKRVVHIVPMWNSELNREVETVWPGIAEHRITASRTGDYAGNDPAAFGPWIAETFKGDKTTRAGKKVSAEITLRFPEWCQMTLYRMVHGQRVAFHGPRVYFREYFGYRKGLPVPNERWTRAPAQMLEKCAEAAALRRAYPEELSEPVAEEMDGRIIDVGGVVVPTKDRPPAAEDFPNDRGVPSDGVVQVADDEDEDDFADDPSIRVVDPAPAAQAAPAPVAQAPAQSEAPKPAEVAPAPAAQESPPAAGPAEEGDPRPEAPPPEGVEQEARTTEKTPAEGMGEEIDLWVMDELPKFTDLGALRDFQRKARFKIDEAPGVSQADKSRLRGRFNAACLEREKVIGAMRTGRK